MDLSGVLSIFKKLKPEELMLLAIVFVLFVEKRCDKFFLGILFYIFLCDCGIGLQLRKV